MSGLNAGMGSARGDQLDAGFAKLQGEDFKYIMQSYEITMGRSTKKEKVDLDLSALARDKDVSGRHARIFYNFNTARLPLRFWANMDAMFRGSFTAQVMIPLN